MKLNALVGAVALAAASASSFAQTPAAAPASTALAEVVVRNDAAFARRETIEVGGKSLPGVGKPADLRRVRVTEAATGKEILAQAMDTDGDYDDDTLVFQADFAGGATARFKLTLGETRTYRPDDFRVYGRFNRERFDDFVWENDKVAFRMYGEALETWVREPLTSSSVDAWVKKTNRLVANEWYLVDNYHKDHGEGGDFYSAGKTRGCGGSGLIAEGRLFTSKNFRRSRVLSRGPIRLLFELEYDAWDVAGVKVREKKRVSLDAGSNFNRFENVYATESGAPLPEGFVYAAGTKKEKGADIRVDPKAGVVRAWEELNRYGKDGWMGCAVIVEPGRLVSTPELDGNVLVGFRGPAPYFAGTGWDRSGDFKTMADFDAHVNTFVSRLASPVSVQVVAPWSTRMADSVMARDPDPLTIDAEKPKWEYTQGLVLKGVFAVGEKTSDPRYFDYAKRYYDEMIAADGQIRTYQLTEYNIDRINPGKALFALYAKTKDEKYKKAMDLLRRQMKEHPRTKEGGFWHKQRYPFQMWLDGLYMGAPFLAQYAQVNAEPALVDDVINQFVWMEKHARDPKTGLLYHGFDESRQQKWADPDTGLSKEFWGRAMGWYAMGLVDTLDFVPGGHPRRGELVAILGRLAAAVEKVQDPKTGVFWQVLDKGSREGNYLESSVSTMFAYAFMKGARQGALEPRFGALGRRIHEGVIKEFITTDDKGVVSIHRVCQVAGLGGDPNGGFFRDGTFEYYVKEKIRSNDPKAVGPFILAALEYEAASK